jgi:protein arginine N-methyltransferase 7
MDRRMPERLPDADVERMIATFDAANRARPDYARRLAGLVEVLAGMGHSTRAVALGRRALMLAPRDAEVSLRVRRIASPLIRKYHVRMMNDAARTSAWAQALQAVIAPGDHVLEIGTGGGVLALAAARAGAGFVTTCESDPVLADAAAAIVAQNGLGDRIRVINKDSRDLILGVDLPTPADVLCCDIFGDSLVDFGPVPALIDVRRLLVHDARTVPAGVSLHLALGHWHEYERYCRMDTAAGFDLDLMRVFVPPSLSVEVDDPGLSLQSPPVTALRLDLRSWDLAPTGRVTVRLSADRDGIVSGVVQWIRLALTDDVFLDTQPRHGARYFAAARFWPWMEPVAVRAGDERDVVVEFHERALAVWDAGSR